MSLYDNLTEILPMIQANAEKAERMAMVPPENIAQLQAAGFFRALQPKAYGGLEMPYPEYARCIALLAKACASTAWSSSLLANHAHGLALFSPQLQQEIWGDSADVLVSSSVAPLGKWSPAEGGIILSGRFGWSSGCDYADWAVLGYMGKNEMGQDGPCFAVVPRSDYQIIDDWDSQALRGTGSKSIVLEDVFVPHHRTESLFGLNFGLSAGYKFHDSDLFYTPFSAVFSLGFAAVALGIAERSIEVFTEKTKTRIRAYTGASEITNVPAQMGLAESVNQTRAAKVLLENDWQEMMAWAQERRMPPTSDLLNWRTQQSYAIKILIEAVSRLSLLSGGSAWLSVNEMQRLFRDIRIIGSHAQTDYSIASQTFGRHLLGLAADAKFY